MVDEEIIYRRLKSLDETLSILRRMQRYSFEEFASEPERYGSVERFLQLAVEVLSDIGSHVVASEALGTVSRFRDVPALLL
jgi:uncharacterized protein YutE (UPF0331/DUF86 family)